MALDTLGEPDYGPGMQDTNQTIVFPVSDAVQTDSPAFDFFFEGSSAALFWALLIAHGLLGLVPVLKGEWRVLKRWPLYLMMLAYAVLTCICETVAFSYTLLARSGRSSNAVYLVYVFFWNASSASFLVLLLALSSGYCITRGDLEGHKGKVLAIPGIVFVAGVASDFTFVYVESTQQLSAAADRYNIVEMTAWESAVWFIGSLANIMCFILAWIYIFDSTQLEIKALDDAQAALQGRRVEDEEEEEALTDAAYAERRRQHQMRATHEATSDDEEDDVRQLRNGSTNGRRANGRANGDATANGGGPSGSRDKRSLGTTSQRTGLLYGMEDSAVGNRASMADVEAPKETVADFMEYTIRKQLLSRFYIGVCAYLIVSILVILLPAFFNAQLQNVIVVLQFVVKYLFTLMLAWIFRPGKDSPYLQVGISDNDADDRGVSALDTELAVTEYHSAPQQQQPQQQTSAVGASSQRSSSRTGPAGRGGGAGASAGAAPQLPVSTPAGDAASAAEAPKRKGAYRSVNRADAAGQQQKPRFTLDEDE